MKKKISLLLCLMMTAIVCLTGCGKTQTTLEYDEAMIEQETEFLINYCQNVDSDTLAQWNDQNEFSKEYQFMMSGLKFTPDSFDGAVDSWQAGIKECGEYVGHGDYTFEAKDDELTVSVPAQFKDRDATIEFVFDKDLYLESMTVSAKFSLGEIMEKAGLNTLLGMGTVFAVLIFISLLISLFVYIPSIERALKNRSSKKEKKAAQEERPAPKRPILEEVVEEEELVDDGELVAVITAAIMAANGGAAVSADKLVVRSIKRVKRR